PAYRSAPSHRLTAAPAAARTPAAVPTCEVRLIAAHPMLPGARLSLRRIRSQVSRVTGSGWHGVPCGLPPCRSVIGTWPAVTKVWARYCLVQRNVTGDVLFTVDAECHTSIEEGRPNGANAAGRSILPGDDVLQRLPAEEPAGLGPHERDRTGRRHRGRGGHVRGDEQARRLPQGVAGAQRLGVGHVH